MIDFRSALAVLFFAWSLGVEIRLTFSLHNKLKAFFE